MELTGESLISCKPRSNDELLQQCGFVRMENARFVNVLSVREWDSTSLLKGHVLENPTCSTLNYLYKVRSCAVLRQH